MKSIYLTLPTFIILILNVFLPNVMSQVSEPEIAKFDFNLTAAHCYDSKEENNVDNTKMWDFKYTGSSSIYASYCYDKDGMGYKYNTYMDDCCGCMKYYCSYSNRRNHLGQPVYYMYWYLRSISTSCCQDCLGTIYPPNQVVSVAFLEDKCATEVTSICKHNDVFSRYNGFIAKTYTSQECCTDESEHSVVGTVKLDPTTCSQKYCTHGKPSFWLESPLFPGECNCCDFNGTLVAEGGVVTVEPGLNATCCTGKLVVDYNVDLPSNCSDPKAIHRSLAFSIDNTGSVSDDAAGIRNLTNSLITGVEDHGYKIPTWILTTFNDVTENIEDNTELVIETSDNALMRDALNAITYSGGGDSAERALQGLLLTLNTIPEHGMIMVFTDNPSKNLELENQLIALRNEKLAKIFFVFAPKYHGTVDDPTWTVFKKLSEGRIYNMATINRTEFLDEILVEIGDDCESMTLEGAYESMKPKSEMAQHEPSKSTPAPSPATKPILESFDQIPDYLTEIPI